MSPMTELALAQTPGTDRHGDMRMTNRWRAVRDGLLLAGVLLAAAQALAMLGGGFGSDALEYWNTHLDHLYAGYTVGALSYAYSPVFAQVIAPLQALPAPVFVAGWFTAQAVMLAWLVRPAPRGWAAVLVLFSLPDLLTGNIHIAMAFALVVGLRYPAILAFNVFTKLSPIGYVWFALRREWRHLAVGIGTVLVLAAASFALAPDLWRQFVGVLWANQSGGDMTLIALPGPLIRAPIAIVLAAWAARTGDQRLLPLATLLALPHIWVASAALFAAQARLTAPDAGRRYAAGALAAARSSTHSAPSS